MSTDPTTLVGTTATDLDGAVLGTVSAVWLDDATGRPSWVGLTEGTHTSPGGTEPVVVVPLHGSRTTADQLQLDVAGALTRDAPRLAATQRLTPDDELRLRAHYTPAERSTTAEHPTTTGYSGTGYSGTTERPAASDHPTTTGSQAPTRSTDEAMTRSEERLSVQASTVPWSRAVLRVETVTEEVMVPVTVTRQRVRVEHLPLTAPTAGTGSIAPGPEGQATDWVTLWGEQPVVSVERVPLERVRLRTEWVTRDDTVTGRLAREEITVDELPPR